MGVEKDSTGAAEQSSEGIKINCFTAPTKQDEKTIQRVLLEITANASSGKKRPPINMVIAVDRSSSMLGSRIASAIEAVRQICLRLNEEDYLGLVAFDEHPVTVRTPGPVAEGLADKLTLRLTRMGLGIGTNIGGAMKKAARLLSTRKVDGAANTLLLLTDGYPSIGMRKKSDLVALAKEAYEHNIIVNTVGIGRNFSEELLSEMAHASNGGFRYVVKDHDTASMADEEIVGIDGLVADGAQLRIDFEAGVKNFELLHNLLHEVEEQKLTINLGRIFAGSTRRVLLELETDQETTDLGSLGFTYHEAGDKEGVSQSLKITASSDVNDDTLQRIGTSYVPLRIAIGLKRVWRRGLDPDMERVYQELDALKEELQSLPAVMKE